MRIAGPRRAIFTITFGRISSCIVKEAATTNTIHSTPYPTSEALPHKESLAKRSSFYFNPLRAFALRFKQWA